MRMNKSIAKGIDRRTFIKVAAVTGGALAAGMSPFRPAWAASADKIKFVTQRYRDYYDERDGYFLRDQGWVEETISRITWPKDGDTIPEFTVLTQSNNPDWTDAWRRWAADGEKLGLKYNIQQVSQARWLEIGRASCRERVCQYG